MANIYDFTVKNQDNTDYPLSNLKGKVLLIVNTATRCGFTKQYEALESLYHDLGNIEFEILDFPCNQFMNQTPESDEEINEFCSLNYNTTFPRFKKIDVNGDNADELYQFLRREKRTDEGKHAKDFLLKLTQLKNRKEKNEINWNFTKFVVDKHGNVVHRFSPAMDPLDIKNILLELLISS